MTGDRTPTGDLRDQLAEALYRRLREQVGSDAGAQIRAEAKADDLIDAVVPVVEAETAALRERAENAEAAVQRVREAERIHRVAHPSPVGGCPACHILAALDQPKETR